MKLFFDGHFCLQSVWARIPFDGDDDGSGGGCVYGLDCHGRPADPPSHQLAPGDSGDFGGGVDTVEDIDLYTQSWPSARSGMSVCVPKSACVWMLG